MAFVTKVKERRIVDKVVNPAHISAMGGTPKVRTKEKERKDMEMRSA